MKIKVSSNEGYYFKVPFLYGYLIIRIKIQTKYLYNIYVYKQ